MVIGVLLWSGGGGMHARNSAVFYTSSNTSMFISEEWRAATVRQIINVTYMYIISMKAIYRHVLHICYFYITNYIKLSIWNCFRARIFLFWKIRYTHSHIFLILCFSLCQKSVGVDPRSIPAISSWISIT